LAGGILAAVLDILAACGIYAARGVSPKRILQAIASGLLGPSAFQGGTGTAVLGLALHFFIATSASLVYYAASRRRPALVQRPLVFGAVYGVAVYVVMTFLVLPLSAVTKRPLALDLVPVMLLVHIGCVGLPIAFATRRWSRSRE
jgi:hypothetical protein